MAVTKYRLLPLIFALLAALGMPFSREGRPEAAVTQS